MVTMRPRQYVSTLMFLITFGSLVGCDPTTAPPTGDSGVIPEDRGLITPIDLVGPVGTPAPIRVPEGVPVDATLSFSFFEPLRVGTWNLTVTRVSDGALVSGVQTYDLSNSRFSFRPAALDPSTEYEARFSGDVRDVSGNLFQGNEPSGNFAWTFATGTPPDTTAPTIRTVTPTATLAVQNLRSPVVVTFSEPVQAESVTPERFFVTDLSSNLRADGRISCVGAVCEFIPAFEWLPGGRFRIDVSPGIADQALARNLSTTSSSTTFSARARLMGSSTLLPTGVLGGAIVGNDAGDFLILGTRPNSAGRAQSSVQIFNGQVTGGSFGVPDFVAPSPNTMETTNLVAAAMDANHNLCVIQEAHLPPGSGPSISTVALYGSLRNSAGQWSPPFLLGQTDNSRLSQVNIAWDGVGQCVALWTDGGFLYANVGNVERISGMSNVWRPEQTALNTLATEGAVNSPYQAVDLNRVATGHLRVAYYTAVGGSTTDHRIWTQDWDASGWSRPQVVGDVGSQTSRVALATNTRGDSVLFWLKRIGTAGAYPLNQLWWSHRIRTGRTPEAPGGRDPGWSRPELVASSSAGVAGMAIRSVGIADAGEINVEYSQTGTVSGVSNPGWNITRNPAGAWSVPSMIGQSIYANVRISNFDRHGGGIVIANSRLTASTMMTTQEQIQMRTKLPGGTVFNASLYSLWVYAATTSTGFRGSIDAQGHALMMFTSSSPSTATVWRWLH